LFERSFRVETQCPTNHPDIVSATVTRSGSTIFQSIRRLYARSGVSKCAQCTWTFVAISDLCDSRSRSGSEKRTPICRVTCVQR
jgi:hypothetical protein